MNDHPTKPPLGATPSATPEPSAIEVAAKLVAVARAAWSLADDAEENDKVICVDPAKFQELSNALDALDALPEPGPNIVATGPAKAEVILESQLSTARAALAQEVEDGKHKSELLEKMLNVAENADETGYVTDCGFVDLDKLHAEVRASIAAQAK